MKLQNSSDPGRR